MKQEGLLFYTDIWLTLVGLGIFLVFFIYMLIRVYKVKNEYMNAMSRMPLEDLEHE